MGISGNLPIYLADKKKKMDSLQKYLSKAPELCFSNTKYENLSNILGLYFYCAFKLQRLIAS